ncbi:MAG TPA: HmuY family protein [Flavobacteriaceae bacterium]|nr:HmuY family protein [Flavobacteriaceae bacterium]
MYYLMLVMLPLLGLGGCSKDESTKDTQKFVVAFESPSLNFAPEETSEEITIVFSQAAPENGSLEIVFEPHNLVYGTDFTTIPAAENGIVVVPVENGTSQASFTFNKLTANPTDQEPEKSVEFSFGKINLTNGIANGNTTLLVSYSESASLGGNFAPNVGGPNEPNQVYVDLSGQTETIVRRDTWDLKFYSGNEFRVKLNSSLFMMAAELPTTNLDDISESDVQNLKTQMQFLVVGSEEFVDDPNGSITETAISEISIAPEENKVYLLKMGYEIGTDMPENGSVAISGESRGWKKIRILREGNNYVLQYADLNSTTHQEFTISKDAVHNFTFFSFETESVVEIAPENWDLNFSTFTEVEEFPTGGLTAYGYSDYAKTNVQSNVKAYQVLTTETSYQNFSSADIQVGNFDLDQRAIGANWRDVFEGTVFPDRFYVLQDSDGNRYKLRFITMVNEDGVRGYPKFEYQLLN